MRAAVAVVASRVGRGQLVGSRGRQSRVGPGSVSRVGGRGGRGGSRGSRGRRCGVARAAGEVATRSAGVRGRVGRRRSLAGSRQGVRGRVGLARSAAGSRQARLVTASWSVSSGAWSSGVWKGESCGGTVCE